MFFSADKIWMDELVEKHLIDPVRTPLSSASISS